MSIKNQIKQYLLNWRIGGFFDSDFAKFYILHERTKNLPMEPHIVDMPDGSLCFRTIRELSLQTRYVVLRASVKKTAKEIL